MQAEEKIQITEATMAAVCGLCHWPYVYHDEETMWAEKCDYCPAAAALEAALDGKETRA